MENHVLSEQAVERGLAPSRARAADVVARLLQASFDLIRETGDLQPTVGEIIQRAGSSNQSFYRHFRSKDELLMAVLDEGARKLTGYLEHRMASTRDPIEAIRLWLAGMMEQALDPEAARATRPFAASRGRLASLFPTPVRETEERLIAPLRSAVDAASKAGALPAGDADRDARRLYDLTMGWIEINLARNVPADREDAAHLIRFGLRGLGLSDASTRSQIDGT